MYKFDKVLLSDSGIIRFEYGITAPVGDLVKVLRELDQIWAPVGGIKTVSVGLLFDVL